MTKCLLSTSVSHIRKVFGNSDKDLHDKLLWYHLFACESHKYAIETALGVLGGEIMDMRTESTNDILKNMLN